MTEGIRACSSCLYQVNPFITLIVVMAGGLVWGIPGMFLFIPLAAIVNVK